MFTIKAAFRLVITKISPSLLKSQDEDRDNCWKFSIFSFAPMYTGIVFVLSHIYILLAMNDENMVIYNMSSRSNISTSMGEMIYYIGLVIDYHFSQVLSG